MRQEEVTDLGGLVAPMLEAACARGRGRANAADILRLCADGYCQLWLGQEVTECPGCEGVPQYGCGICSGRGRVLKILAVAVTEVVDFPKKRVCRFFLIAGSGIRRIRGLLATMERWARLSGCDSFMCEGRIGWERFLPDYDEIGRMWEKEL